jgi:hypothetical protein
MQIGDIAVAFITFISLRFLVLILLSKLIGLLKNWRNFLAFTLALGAAAQKPFCRHCI